MIDLTRYRATLVDFAHQGVTSYSVVILQPDAHRLLLDVSKWMADGARLLCEGLGESVFWGLHDHWGELTDRFELKKEPDGFSLSSLPRALDELIARRLTELQREGDGATSIASDWLDLIEELNESLSEDESWIRLELESPWPAFVRQFFEREVARAVADYHQLRLPGFEDESDPMPPPATCEWLGRLAVFAYLSEDSWRRTRPPLLRGIMQLIDEFNEERQPT